MSSRAVGNAGATPKVCQSCGARYTTDALFCPNDGTPLTTATIQQDGSGETDPYLGREIGGHIEIRQLAGVGAMGRVYRAFQKGIDRDVAVKVLHRELSANQQLVARFHREAKVASRLQHPNVVQVHLAGQLPDGALYIVMEYLDGMSLQSALAAAGGSMPLPRALHIGLQICDAVGEAHAQGIVHRDLKPENVMLVRRGENADYVKVLDFGIARLNWGEQSMATAAGLIFGTARYISPEGAQGEAVGPGGDVYAIATLLYQLLAGRTPFEGEQAVALLVQQIHDKPPPIKSVARAGYLPDVLADAIMANLAKAPTERAEDARVLGRLLVEAAKAAGLSVDELMARSALLGARPSVMQLAPMQRTKQLQLEPELQKRLLGETRVGDGRDSWQSSSQPPASPSSGGAARPRDAEVQPRTIAIAPPTPLEIPKAAGSSPSTMPSPRPPSSVPSSPGDPPRQQVSRLADVPAAASTTKWAVPPELQTKLSAAQPPAAAPVTSSVEPTLDDDDGTVPPPPRATAPPRPRTEFASPDTGLLGESPRPPGLQLQPTLENPRAALASRPSPAPPAAYPAQAPRRVLVTALGSSVPSRAGTTNAGSLGGELESELSPRRSRSRQAVVILFCFMLGVGIASFVLYQMGRIGPAAANGTIDDYVARANAAMRAQHWDAPPGDNVKDITNEALAKWPRDSRIRDIREHATDELVKEAIGRQLNRDLAGAQHLAHLANELDPTDTTAQHLVASYDQEAKPQTSSDAVQISVVDAGAVHGGTQRPQPPLVGGPRASLDLSAVKPRIGQPVTFIARVAVGQKGHVDEVHFRLDGPGLVPDTRLTALADGPGVYQTAFTFFEAGKYEVAFNAKVDGVIVKVTRTFSVDDGEAIPAPLPTPDGGKWL